jgi:hypothetical protein
MLIFATFCLLESLIQRRPVFLAEKRFWSEIGGGSMSTAGAKTARVKTCGKKNAPVKVFVSYSHQDEIWRQRLGTSLRALESSGLIQCWHDRKIIPGDDWKGQIHSALKDSDIFILLVSPDFIASEYCSDVEVCEAILRHKAGTARVIPVILRPAIWDHAPFGSLQALPANAKPIFNWSNREKALLDVVNGIRKAAEHLLDAGCEMSESVPDQSEQRDPMPKCDLVPKTLEQELKFAGAANSQLKFVSTDSPDQAIEKLATVCQLLDIQIGSLKQKSIADEYFDDSGRNLFKAGCSFRRRVDGLRRLVTMKQIVNTEGGFGLQRREEERECDDQEFRRLIRDPRYLKNSFTEALAGLEKMPLGRLEKILTINNNRASVSLETAVAQYTFSYDRFYFFDESEGRFSEYFTEIEVELDKGRASDDSQLQKLTHSFSTFFSHSPLEKSKLERGLDWLRNGSQSSESVCAVAFEVIGFGGGPFDWQKQALQSLNHHAKAAIRDIRGASAAQDASCIPTGDGMVLLFDINPGNIISVIANVQQKLRSVNGRKPISFRVGIDIGNVFKFSDVNENLNYGGSAIQIARQVMMLGSEWHILTTKKAFQLLNVTPPIQFRSGMYVTENSEEVEVVNIYKPSGDHATDSFGNPADPLGR